MKARENSQNPNGPGRHRIKRRQDAVKAVRSFQVHRRQENLDHLNDKLLKANSTFLRLV
jgi:hypothetical protein